MGIIPYDFAGGASPSNHDIITERLSGRITPTGASRYLPQGEACRAAGIRDDVVIVPYDFAGRASPSLLFQARNDPGERLAEKHEGGVCREVSS